MASAPVTIAVEALLAANWTTTPILGTNTAGQPPADGGPFVAVQYPVARENQHSFGAPGSNAYKETGAFRIVLNIPRGEGLPQALAWADTLRAVFRGVDTAGVSMFAPSPPVTNDANDLGSYYQISFAVPYWYWLFG
ncbi:MAG: hypothetical protein HXX10_07670 [Rhodoplanes sp.]|uniref:phage tail terminator-like protein n=1 Tax=Rhodoplanes sp. TaxID=1968906 RepID=UPI0018513A9F|nr:phage tail terminator-like protein [Rhodoplanes sp.]NVO13899.1 hypothetical protein [Rhodoplanes sp.]